MGAKSCACTCSPTDETFRMVRRHEYMAKLVAELDSYTAQGCDAKVASGGGRMAVTMDRYEADWGMVERGWRRARFG